MSTVEKVRTIALHQGPHFYDLMRPRHSCVRLSLFREYGSLLAHSVLLRNQRQQSSYAGASQTLGSGRSGAEPACTEPAHSGRSLGVQHGQEGHHLRGLAEFPDSLTLACAVPTQPVERRLATRLPPPH